jgi:hypothetical protein
MHTRQHPTSLKSTDFQFRNQTAFYKGKVRDVYTIGNDLLVMVASDRISAFDVVLPEGIPFKGQVLNQTATHFLKATSDIVPNWLIGVPAAKLGLVVNHWTIERIVRELSWPVARNMLLTASNYSAEELARMGSIQRLGTLEDALAWASDIAKLAPLTIRGHKVALESSAGEPAIDALVAACREEALASNDAREGREAFMEKRQPKFLGS